MKLERESFAERAPDVVRESPWVITHDYIDDYGNHLNEAKALVIFEAERLRMFPKERMLEFGVLALVKEQHARYHAQVYEGENVDIKTALYVDGARLYFLHQMQRGGIVVVDNLVETAMVNAIGRATRIPNMLLQDLQPNRLNH